MSSNYYQNKEYGCPLQLSKLKIKDVSCVQKIGQMLKTSIRDYETLNTVTFPFYYIN